MRTGRAERLHSRAVIARIVAAGLIFAAMLAPAAGARLTEPPVDVPNIPDRALFAVPLNGNLGSPFGYRWGRMHEGIDIEGWAHTRVHAALSGIVTRVGWLRSYWGYGLVIKIRHDDGIVTMYAHLAHAFVKPGDSVVRGQLIAQAGCTGSCTGVHLHFQVWVDGKLTDPLRFLGDRVHLRETGNPRAVSSVERKPARQAGLGVRGTAL
jgi:murein DD-endopeptidase MepM/ murein hydrolase activator NlpD